MLLAAHSGAALMGGSSDLLWLKPGCSCSFMKRFPLPTRVWPLYPKRQCRTTDSFPTDELDKQFYLTEAEMNERLATTKEKPTATTEAKSTATTEVLQASTDRGWETRTVSLARDNLRARGAPADTSVMVAIPGTLGGGFRREPEMATTEEAATTKEKPAATTKEKPTATTKEKPTATTKEKPTVTTMVAWAPPADLDLDDALDELIRSPRPQPRRRPRPLPRPARVYNRATDLDWYISDDFQPCHDDVKSLYIYIYNILYIIYVL
jgi:hypothetical protein